MLLQLRYIIPYRIALHHTVYNAIACHTYKTKLKLDKEVGGGDLSELCTITYLIAYPYA